MIQSRGRRRGVRERESEKEAKIEALSPCTEMYNLFLSSGVDNFGVLLMGAVFISFMHVMSLNIYMPLHSKKMLGYLKSCLGQIWTNPAIGFKIVTQR